MVLLMATLLGPDRCEAKGRAGEFDHYAMALSWSPQHCAIKPADREQCSRQTGIRAARPLAPVSA